MASCPYPHATKRESQDQNPSDNNGQEIVQIPQPPEKLFGLFGNLPDVDPSFPSKSFWKLAELYGPIFKLRLRSDVVIVSNQKYVNEICDEDRFEKIPSGVLVQIRPLAGDGLFTAFPEEENWWKAHRILVPVFGPMSIRKMFPEMMDISSQMVIKWDRQGSEHEINCSDDLTRLAFDTIGLCAFGYRFNEFYSDNVHPFAQQMADVLLESGKRATRPEIVNQMYYQSEQERQNNIAKMHAVCDEIIKERKRNPVPDSHDLLNTMLNAKDPETGEGLSDENIRAYFFQVAGHETTSGTLSFTYYNLLKNPDKLHKAQQEVDEIVGQNPLELKHIPQLKYIDACIKETLRLSSPITVISVKPKKDTILGGKYFVSKDNFMTANLRFLHRDPEVWGDDVEVFRPERMLDGGFESLPPNSWKPFGNGRRACIGRLFAEQEMIMNIALVLQQFQLELANPSYELILKATLTIKPADFKIKVRRRPERSLKIGIVGGGPSAEAATSKAHNKQTNLVGEESSMSIFYGGNSGTCKTFAEDILVQASERGFKATVLSLDAATENLPKDRPVIIVTSSYEGKPPDNARKFVAWLEHLQGDKTLDGVSYALFGVGNSDWASTFHRIPKLVNETMQKLGAKQLLNAGLTNAKKDLIGPFDDWTDALWKELQNSSAAPAKEGQTGLSVSITPNPVRKTHGDDQFRTGVVLSNHLISSEDADPTKHHMDVMLPDGTDYIAGDYLVVLPRNNPNTVSRVLRHFGLDGDDLITVNGSKKKFLPTETTTVDELLSTAVELNSLITNRQLDLLVPLSSADHRAALESLKQNYDDVLNRRFSVLDILEDHQVPLPFATYLDMLPSLSPRQYSISSSPLSSGKFSSAQQAPDELTRAVSITYDVLDTPSLSNPEKRQFHGVCSSYLAARRAGDRISCFVRSTNAGFRLPADPKTPVVMIAAGTGIAPMRAFIQERAAIAAAGQREIGPALLFFGCKDPAKDFIYEEELKKWEEEGVVKVYTAFSRVQYKYKHVDEAVWAERDAVAQLWSDGGKIFICGRATTIGKTAGEVIKKIYMEKSGVNEEEAAKWLDGVKEVRYVSDVFG